MKNTYKILLLLGMILLSSCWQQGSEDTTDSGAIPLSQESSFQGEPANDGGGDETDVDVESFRN